MQRRKHFSVAVLAGVLVKHEVHKRALEARAQVPINGEPRSGDLRSALKVEDAEALAKLPVRLGGEGELRRRAPAADFDIVVGGVADGNSVAGQVGDAGQDVAQLRIVVCRQLLGSLALGLQCLLFFEIGGGVLLRLAQLLEFFGQLVASRLYGFRLGDGGAALGVDGVKVLQDDGGIHAALAQLLFDEGQVVADKCEVKHKR